MKFKIPRPYSTKVTGHFAWDSKRNDKLVLVYVRNSYVNRIVLKNFKANGATTASTESKKRHFEITIEGTIDTIEVGDADYLKLKKKLRGKK